MTNPRDVRRALLGSQLAGANSDSIRSAPQASAPPARVVAGAVGAVSRSLSRFEQELQAAKDLAAAGERLVEIDGSQIDPSFIRDRLAVDEDAHRLLVQAIREQGQQIPILVRRSPDDSTRFQLAFGHRRLKACLELEIPVKAIVRDLSDVELAVAQGQENSVRKDLTFIEKALFARRMEDRGFDREASMAALSTDKTELSKLLSVTRSIPSDVIEAIGPAPKAGRPRWLGLAEKIEDKRALEKVRRRLGEADCLGASSDERFGAAFAAATARPKRNDLSEAWATPDGRKAVRIQRTATSLVLSVDARTAPEFGEFLVDQLPAIYAAFKSR
jgi:ParB family transcriptional regulator, chromosome partitioning protein